ncbi:15342_t:CDS:1 [Funneliformis caledonium]|uniref:15342_t:CDS:1 n=1 Tax=Funneliformis caledonium TaxID=1117310 RepID=A0A9N9C144_9GLOM|nr:15342_t:CDS:1 [Funneliformis caledonium]
MVNAQEYIEQIFPKHFNEIRAVEKHLEGHLDLSDYPNLTIVDIGHNSQLTSLKLAHSNRITWMSLLGTNIDNFSCLAGTPNLQKVLLPRSGDKIGDDPGNAYIAKVIRESCQENNRLLSQFNKQIQTQLEQEKNNNSQRIKELEKQLANVQQENQALQSQSQQKQQTINDQQSQMNELSNIAFNNNSYNFTKLKKEIFRLKVQELTPQVRNESTKLDQLITETKSKAGHFSLVVDLILENQKQIVQINETSQRDKFIAKAEAYQTILVNNLTEEELQTLLNKQKEVLKLEKHLESLQQI